MKDSNDFSKYNLDEMIKEYSDVGKSKNDISSSSPVKNTEKKKFVVNMDESLIDSPQNDNDESKSTSGGGIYFSNYQNKHRDVKNKYLSTNTLNNIQDKIKDSTSKATIKKTIKKKRKNNNVAMAFFAFIFIFTTLFSYIGITCVGDMLAVNRSDENVAVSIPAGSNYQEIIKILKKNKLIKRPAFCEMFIKFRHFDTETYLSGDYYLNSKMGVEGMMKDIMEEPVVAESISLSFPEGWTISQIAEKLEKNDVCKATQFINSAKSANYSFDFISEIVDNENRYQKLEGYMFPDTYDFYVGADINYVIRKFLSNFDNKWEPEYDARAKKLGCTRDEIITIASIIQREAGDKDQMKIISSVIHNRLNNPSEYPTIACDSTALYISNFVTPLVGESMGAVLREHYDTYATKGLPPGPICNPGMDAIKAALYPEETNYYFFAHDNAGKIYLATNYQDHKSNLIEILKTNG
ncbi:MAG: endolytic transglycosylase MltG [Ruminococcus sp.]|nr:endolytic transglycosylase MltG [Candidatus Copronaster equi]